MSGLARAQVLARALWAESFLLPLLAPLREVPLREAPPREVPPQEAPPRKALPLE